MDDSVQNRPGRHASRPRELPLRGWKDIAVRAKNKSSSENLSIVSAGVAYYSLLAVFPALAAIVTLYGLVSSPDQVQQQVAALSQIVPHSAANIIYQQLNHLASSPGTTLGLGLAIALLVSVFSSMKGMTALMTALNIVYGEQEGRGFFKRNGLALLLTFGSILFAVIAILLIIATPAILSVFNKIGLNAVVGIIIDVARWPILGVAMILWLTVLYRYAPNRSNAQWKWVSWGAVLGTVLWLVASGLFSFYVSNFGSFNETYGSIAGVVILIMWFFVTAYVILFSAAIDAEMEHQTTYDTTAGIPKPMGRRGAYVADTEPGTKEK